MVEIVANAFLWPGTKLCEKMGIDPKGDAGLIRSMFNMLIYLSVTLAGCWIFLV